MDKIEGIFQTIIKYLAIFVAVFTLLGIVVGFGMALGWYGVVALCAFVGIVSSIAFKYAPDTYPRVNFKLSRTLLLFTSLVTIITVIGLGISHLSSTDYPEMPKAFTNAKERTISFESNGINYNHHTRVWESLDGGRYTLSYTAADTMLQQMTHADYGRFHDIKQLYDYYARTSYFNVLPITAQLDSIAKAHHLNYRERLNLVVSFVQDIPYVLILSTPCESVFMPTPRLRKYLDDGKPCHGNVFYGVRSPTNFLYDLNGDCDSRTLLIYLILTQMDIGAAVFISKKHRHALLGVKIDGSRARHHFVKHANGVPYVLWETTAVHHSLGVISHEMTQRAAWKLALRNYK